MLVPLFHPALGCAETWRVTHVGQSLLPMTRLGQGLGTCLAGSPGLGPAPPSVSSGEAELCRACQAAEVARWPACPDVGEILRWPLQTKPRGRCTPHRRRAWPGLPKVTRGTLHAGDAALPAPRCLQEDGRQPKAHPRLEPAPCFGDFSLSRG